MTPTAEPGVSKPPVDIMQSTVCISITFGSLGNHRKVSTSEVEVNAEKDLINVSKKLLDSEELKAITKHDGETRAWLMSICLPSLFRSGIYLVPIAAIEKVQERLEAAKTKRQELIEKFLLTYESCKAEAQTKLRDLFNATDYPSIGRVRNAFVFEWAWITFSTPGKLKEISQGFFEQEKHKAEAHWQEATQAVQELLREQFKELVSHLVERLTPGPDGKPKKFKESTIKNMKDFLENFSIRNVTDDNELQALVTATTKLMTGVEAGDLRSNEAVRGNIQKGFTLVQECLDKLVVEGRTRKIILEDTDDASIF